MPDEIGELKEHAEEGAHEPSLAPVTLTMAILAVVIATVTLLGHRAHTEEVLLQTRAADQWAYFQAKEIRRRSYELFLDELSIFSLQDAKQVDAVREKYKKQVDRYSDELKEIEAEARASDRVQRQPGHVVHDVDRRRCARLAVPPRDQLVGGGQHGRMIGTHHPGRERRLQNVMR